MEEKVSIFSVVNFALLLCVVIILFSVFPSLVTKQTNPF